jgi:hypothetical protein
MATAVSTPIKSHMGLFSTRTAGGRMPLTPSPRTRTAAMSNNNSSPFTPERKTLDNESIKSSKSTYGGNLTSHFASRRQEPHTATRQSLISPETHKLLVVLWNSVSPTSRLLVLVRRPPAAANHERLPFDRSLPRPPSHTVTDSSPIVQQAQLLQPSAQASWSTMISNDQRQVVERAQCLGIRC